MDKLNLDLSDCQLLKRSPWKKKREKPYWFNPSVTVDDCLFEIGLKHGVFDDPIDPLDPDNWEEL